MRRFLGAGVYQSLPAGAGGYGGLARRVSDVLHALPSGDRAGHADIDLRISDHDLPVDRHGSGQRVHVRRILGGAGSGHDGDAGHQSRPGSWSRGPCIRNIAKCSRTYAQHQGMPVPKFGYDAESGRIDLEDLESKLNDKTPAVIIQSPNFFGDRGGCEASRGDRAPAGRAAGVRVHRSRFAGLAGTAARRRYRGGRTAIVRDSAQLRRSVRRHHRDQGKIHAADAGPPRGRDQGHARATGRSA